MKWICFGFGGLGAALVFVIVAICLGLINNARESEHYLLHECALSATGTDIGPLDYGTLQEIDKFCKVTK